MARRRKGRKINGILLLDKPAGMSSNQALQKVRRIYQAQKGGHTGNLDGPATGLLPCCFGEATKLSSYLLDANKSYHCWVKLGANTSTLDATGEILKTRPIPDFKRSDLESILSKFRGSIRQIPPMYSALKHDGQRLYQLAQQGVEVPRKERLQEIYRLELTELNKESFHIEVDCSKGTYIRTLAEDIGEQLGCGAYVQTLRRSQVACFDLNDAHQLIDLEELADDQPRLDGLLLPVDAGLNHLEIVMLTEQMAKYFLNGQALHLPSAPNEGLIRVYQEDPSHPRFLGLAEAMGDGQIAPKRLISTAE